MDNYKDEVYVKADRESFKKTCLDFHEKYDSPVMAFFAVDKGGLFQLYCGFESVEQKKWFFVTTDIPKGAPEYDSLSSEIYSASLFEREIYEMFGIKAKGSPDLRRLKLHDEVWPEGNYPLRKDFVKVSGGTKNDYIFRKVEGEGVFEVPVGPVHAGIIGPGHFRFSAAGEPIINLEIRLGFTHRGVEKLFENKRPEDCLKLAECVSGDSSFAHSWAFCSAIEKINSVEISQKTNYLRSIFLELERMYNHVNDIGGIAVDVGFSFPSAYASIMKETILALNEKLSGSRYLKGINTVGGVSKEISADSINNLLKTLIGLQKDMGKLKEMLFSNVTFMDRVDSTGLLSKSIAEDLGVTGLPARASGINKDLRKDFAGHYEMADFEPPQQTEGDVLARLNIRFEEFEQSIKIIRRFAGLLPAGENEAELRNISGEGFGLGYIEGWRGPVLYWVEFNKEGLIERCKIVDPSFHNWQGLSYAVLGNIIPDFPLCNKSFDLSYSGNDL